MAFRVVKELENGLMEIIMKEILKMVNLTVKVNRFNNKIKKITNYI